jgi:DNA-binding transcriptional LysR family regulator
MEWDDLRYFSAVMQHGGLSGAARVLGVSAQTVGRRIATLEQRIGVSLFVRHSAGYRPTTDARLLAIEADKVEAAMAGLQASVHARSERLEGLVRLAAPEMIAVDILLPALQPFLHRHPALELALVTGIPSIGIARGEADIALRLVRPERGALTVRQVGTMAHGLFAAPGEPTDIAASRLVGWTSDIDLPSARWLRQVTGREPDIRLNHLASHGAAIRAGIGIGVLPRFLADGLVRIETPPPPVEPIWIITHATATTAPRVRALYDEVARIITTHMRMLAAT